MNFKKINNLTGWAVFVIAFFTYFLTREARGSLWDCGEFVSCAYKVQLPHPPGAPIFVLLGRFFILLFGNNPMTAANAVNTMSAIASAFTILFLFWTITHFARKMFVTVGVAPTPQQLFTIMASGVVGALAYNFSDSFWFSAGEGEVYGLSSFFTALVFWLMLKWEHADEKAGNDMAARTRADRWIVFLFFMMGLSIGVHILNLLTIPAIVLIYYYRCYKPTIRGSILAFIIGCIVTGIVTFVVIQYTMKAAGHFDIFFVNKLGMHFFTGFTFYFIALLALIIWGLRFNEKNATTLKRIIWFTLFLFMVVLPFVVIPGEGLKFFRLILLIGIAVAAGYFLKTGGLKLLKLCLWSYAFMLLGYLMFLTAIIRANADPAINMNYVVNPMNLVYYLSREQYGEAPLIYGPHFAAQYKYGDDGYVIFNEGEMEYVQGKTKYVPVGRKKKPEFESSDKQIFPRIWDNSNDQYHAEFYATWLNLEKTQDERTGQTHYEAPSYTDNFRWLFTYQMGFMYWRYFMWNFAGKQNDVQGQGNRRDGNWISGISFIDNQRLGNQAKMPDSLKQNKSHNRLYYLPFILGIIGCVYQFIRNKKDWIVNFLLFFMTGLAIVFYLNQPGNQPRERDYAYVGSFYAFAIWIGLAVASIVRLAKEKEDKKTFQNSLIYGSILTFFITLLSCANESPGDYFMAALYTTILYAAVSSAIIFIVRTLSSAGKNLKMLNIATSVICLLIPVLMGQQEWDDHDRSNKTTAPDIAKDYLESCAPNAVLFTFGDNDTYPLWYAQEVENVRPDIRIINTSLLGIDWYINLLRNKINDADSLDVIWTPEQIEGHNREYLRYQQEGDKNVYYNLYNVMKNTMGAPKLDPETGRDVGPDHFPVDRFYIKVDTEAVQKNGTVLPGDSVVSQLRCEIPQNKLSGGLQKSDFAMLCIIASNAEQGWKRPIYFTMAFGELGFGQYLRKDGLSYRLVPIVTKPQQMNWVTEQSFRQMGLGGSQMRYNNSEALFTNIMTKFKGGGGDKGVYFDEENRRHILELRELLGEAAGNLADLGKKDSANKILDKAEQIIPEKALLYGMTSRFNIHNQTSLIYLEGCYKAGKKDLAEKVRKAVRKDLEQQKAYYDDLKVNKPDALTNLEGSEVPINEIMLQTLDAIEKRYAPETQVKKQNNKLNIQPNMVLNPAGDSTHKTDSPKKDK